MHVSVHRCRQKGRDFLEVSLLLEHIQFEQFTQLYYYTKQLVGFLHTLTETLEIQEQGAGF